MNTNRDLVYTILMSIVTGVVAYTAYTDFKQHGYVAAILVSLIAIWNVYWLIRSWWNHTYTLSEHVIKHKGAYVSLWLTYFILFIVFKVWDMQALLTILALTVLINLIWLTMRDQDNTQTEQKDEEMP